MFIGETQLSSFTNFQAGAFSANTGKPFGWEEDTTGNHQAPNDRIPYNGPIFPKHREHESMFLSRTNQRRASVSFVGQFLYSNTLFTQAQTMVL